MFVHEKNFETSIKVMIIVLCILLIGFSLCDSNEPTIITKFDTNDISTENYGDFSSFFPTIDPNIVEDVNLTTVCEL